MSLYLLSVHHTDGDPIPTPEVMEKMYKDVDAFNNELKAQDLWVFGGGLHPINSATTVRPQNGEVLVTDGPYAETKEQLGGFWIIKAPELDAALELAKKGAIACGGPVEVRPFQDDTED